MNTQHAFQLPLAGKVALVTGVDLLVDGGFTA
jgi:hypothetical protein